MGILLCLLISGADAAPADAGALKLSDSFRRLRAAETGRLAVQLTGGEAFCYPLYFYIPSITRDRRYLVHHRAEEGEVQIYRLDLATGACVPLTRAACRETRWRPWGVESGRGVLDHRSVLNVPRNLAVYFDGNRVRGVDVETLEDRLLFEIPQDREAIGQNGVTPDGKWLAYIHAPRGSEYGKPCRGAAVALYNFDSGENRDLVRIDAAIDHVTPYDNRHLIFAHPHNSSGMMMADLDSEGHVLLRQGDPGVRGRVIHTPITRRGVAYEVPELKFSGLYDPLTRRRFEFKLPEHFQYIHTGCDPEGRLWFYENDNRREPGDGDVHDLWALLGLDADHGDRWLRLVGNWPTYGGGQKAHFHPRLTPDRRWILLTAGDPRTQTNHLFLLDVSDLADTEGISADRLSAAGENDLTD
jgi:hypothetical protein